MIKSLGAFVIGTMAVGGLLQVTGWTFAPPPAAIAVFAVVAMLATLTAVIWLYRNGRFFHGLPAMPPALALERQRYIEIDSMPKPARTIGAPPVREALAPRTPVEWARPMYEELELVSPQLRLAIHRTFLLLLEKHASEWGDEIARELQAAQRHVIRGEIAS